MRSISTGLCVLALVGCKISGLPGVGGKSKSSSSSGGKAAHEDTSEDEEEDDAAPAADKDKKPAKGGHGGGSKIGSWCDGYKVGEDSHAKWVDGYIESEGWSARVRSYIAMSVCDKPGDDARAKQYDGWRDKYIADFALSSRDFNDMVAQYISGPEDGRKNLETFEKKVKKLSRLERAPLTPILDSHAGRSGDLYVAGDRADPTQLQRVGLILSCLSEKPDEGDAYAVLCAPDLEDLDRKAFDSEIASYSAFEKTVLREGFGEAKRRVTVWKKHIEDGSGKEWKKIVIDGPAAGIAKWNDLYDKNKTVLDAALDANAKLLDDPDSAKGCGSTMLGHFKKFVAANKPKNRDDAWKVLHNAVGSPLVIALQGCQAVDGNILAARSYEEVYKYRPEGPKKQGDSDSKDDDRSSGRLWIGPRTAGYWGAIDALAEVVAKKKKLPFREGQVGSLPDVDQVQYDDADLRFSTSSESGSGRFGRYGTIKSAKPSKGGVLVEFKREKQTFYEQECHSGDRIEGINADGTFDYGTYCRPTNKTYTVDVTESKVWIPKMFAAGIKPGVTMIFYADTKPKPQAGFPIELYADKKMKKLVGYLGVAF